ncbi:MAG TPA: site-2 protease family protein [Pseudonocardiaceae bacterium]
MRATGLAPSPLFLLLVAATVAGGALAALTTGAARTGGIVLLVLGGWTVSLCLHEFAHALTAYWGGDRSVHAKGYLTLDIRRYTDPVMSLLLPLLLLAYGGIPLPGGAVWIDRTALRSRAVSSAVSLAGPLTNLALGVLLIAVVDVGGLPDGLTVGLSYLALVQVLAFVLNILPVPGLDGFGVLEPYLPVQVRQFASRVSMYVILGLFVLIISVPALGTALFRAGFAVFAAFGGDPLAAATGWQEFQFWR